MTTPLLTTKLHIPPIRPNLVPRPRLIEKVNEGPRWGRKLTLISALAGFGKTTQASEWVQAMGRVIVEPDLSVPGHPDVLAIGDLAHCMQAGDPLPGVAPVAMQQGRYVTSLIEPRFLRNASTSAALNRQRQPGRHWAKRSRGTTG